ncbi:unnamed protein product [Gongylonema pulchrum]|uniref:Pex2_Pex12 domain-containing protein n=1 Tax=Gongylonema pulchrum TaxID=637853 RepID=A0A183DZC7_9BILA|nr:unnamed protein product [Gongylonema pulchrum]
MFWPLYEQLNLLIFSVAKHSAVVSRMQHKWEGPLRMLRQILDTALGVTVWKALADVDFFSDHIFKGLAMMIVHLEQLIHSLTTYPAGLKLNAHLNAILSQFFVYHIYLWQSKYSLFRTGKLYCRLAILCITSIKSLWRVFRGKKYNPLRVRVDSVRLDTRQLFIATLFFIILLFLLPTILVYFFVFSPVILSTPFVKL